MTISVDVNALFDQYHRRIDLAIKKIALDLLRRIIMKTPVDTGRARGGWQVGVNTEPSRDTEPDRSGNATISEGEAAILRAAIGDTIVFINRVPYIVRLENGWSGQAPQGMVHVSIMEVQAHLGNLR